MKFKENVVKSRESRESRDFEAHPNTYAIFKIFECLYVLLEFHLKSMDFICFLYFSPSTMKNLSKIKKHHKIKRIQRF